MFKLIVVALLGMFAGAAQTTYVFVSLTGNDIHRFATATHMNAVGAAIGVLDADSKPVIFDPLQGTIYPAFVESLGGINASGDIIGVTFGGPSSEGGPFVSTPPYTNYQYLTNAFGPDTVYSIDAINDRGDMIGSPLPPQWFPNLYIGGALAINNAGQVLAYGYPLPMQFVNAPPIQYFLYTPGEGDIPLPSIPTALNNNGDLLYGGCPYCSPPVGPQYIQTASGQIPLPPGYQWTGFNDDDEAVGFSVVDSPLNIAIVTPVYYSVATGVVNLSTRFQNTHALLEVRPVTINDDGEILVNFTWTPFPGLPVAPSAGVGLLVPQRSPAPNSASSAAASVTRLRNYTMNGTRVPVSGPSR
jgi:hypothetical protein